MEHLAKRIKQYGIPRPPYLPQGNNVLIFRLPSETISAGGIIVPEEHQEPKPMGVIIGAGLAARDVMESSLIQLGDIVWFGRFAGWEKEIQRDPMGTGKSILQMKIADVLGSCDALERFDSYEIKTNDKSQHVFVPKTNRKAA
jgi:chaperonin GroES